MFKAFNSVSKVTGLGPHCPARTNLFTGELQLNMDVWPYLTKAEQREVIAHEEGHWVLQTINEDEADEYALKKQVRQGYSPRLAVLAMANILEPGNAEHENRATRRLLTAEEIDRSIINSKTRPMYTTFSRFDGGCNCQTHTGQPGDPFVNYGVLGVCLSKKCREKKAAAQEAKAASKNEARILLAANGVQTGLGGVFQSLGNAIAGATQLATGGANVATQALTTQSPNAVTQQLGGGVIDQNTALMEQYAAEQAAAEQKRKRNTTLLIVGIVLTVVVVGVILYLKNKNKAKVV